MNFEVCPPTIVVSKKTDRPAWATPEPAHEHKSMVFGSDEHGEPRIEVAAEHTEDSLIPTTGVLDSAEFVASWPRVAYPPYFRQLACRVEQRWLIERVEHSLNLTEINSLRRKRSLGG